MIHFISANWVSKFEPQINSYSVGEKQQCLLHLTEDSIWEYTDAKNPNLDLST